MAYNLTNFTDYVAKDNQVLTKTLFGGGDTGKFALKMAGVKGSTKVPHMSGAVALQSGSCPNPSGSRIATEVTITVEPFTVIEDFCQDDLETKFPNLALGSNNNGDNLIPWEEEVIDTIVAGTNETLELTYWRGTKGSGSYPLFDGFIAQADNAVGVIDGNPDAIDVATGINKDNVIGIVEGMRVAAPAKVKRDKSFSILVGDDVFDMYIQAQKDANQYHYNAEHDEGVFKIGGSQATLYRVFGLSETDRIFASVGRNFIMGADAPDEQNIAEVFYDKTDDKTYVRIKGKAGVTIANADEIVSFELATQ